MSSSVSSLGFAEQPKGLSYLFFAELWERFSFYGLRALLVLYLTTEFLYSDTKAYGVYAAYFALVYTTPIIGGLLADRILGKQRAIVLGGILICFGHIFLAMMSEVLFFLGLAFIISGTGLFKANISALLGDLYKHGDPRRDAGFTLFYVGINLGGFLAPIVCGYAGLVYGWHYGFGLAAFGMFAGLITFYRGLVHMEGKGQPPIAEALYRDFFMGLTLEKVIYMAAFISVPIFAILLGLYDYFDYFMPAVGVAVMCFLFYLAVSLENQDRLNILTFMVLLVFFMVFASMYEQAGSSINLFTDRNVDRFIFGWEIPTAWFQSLNPMLIILLGPIVAQLWIKLSKQGIEPYTPFKFFLGLSQTTLGFGVLALSGYAFGQDGSVAFVWVVLAYILHSIGELCISPVALSMVTKLAPRHLTGTLMGIWFIALAYGNYLAGVFARWTSTDRSPEELNALVEGAKDPVVAEQMANLAIYSDAFYAVTLVGAVASVILLITVPLLNPVFKREAQQKD